MAHLWVTIEGLAPTLLSFKGGEVLEGSARAWPHRIGPAQDRDGRVHRELWGPVLPWNPALCLWVPLCCAVVVVATA